MPDEQEEAVETPEVAADEEEAAEGGPQAAVERVGPTECVIRVEADADYLRERYQKELAALQAEVALPGFRRGKAPAGLVEKRMGSSLRNDLVSSVVTEGYDEAVEEHDLTIVEHTDEPDLENLAWEPGQPLSVEFRCDVLPQIELDEAQYKALHVEVPALEPTDEMLAAEMERFAQQFSTWEEATGAVDWDDYVEADVAVPDADWQETIGFYPRAERIGPFAVEGMKGALAEAKLDDKVELDATLTDDPSANRPELAGLAGQALKLRVELKRVMRRRVPELDDDLAKKIGLSSAAEIEPLVRERLEASLKERKEQVTREAVTDEIIRAIECPMPTSLTDRAAERENLRLLVRLLRMGVPRQEAERQAGSDRERRRDAVERRLKASYLLRKVAEKERIVVTETEVDSQVRGFASRQGWREERARGYLEERGMVRELRDDMRESKTLDFLIENARIKEVPTDEFARRHGQPDDSGAEAAPAQ
jgi:trigger factor